MNHLHDEYAIYLLTALKQEQTNLAIISLIDNILLNITENSELEYSDFEIDTINKLVELSQKKEKPMWSGIREPQATTQTSATGGAKPKRTASRAADALLKADYLCEYNPSDRFFLRKSGVPYTEPHHLIPLFKYKYYTNSLDIMENIVSLCSHCHNLLHYGRLEDKEPILRKLYKERKKALEKCDLRLTFDQLLAYYE